VIAFTRLTLAVVFFAASLLAVFPAPAYKLWMLAIGVTEWGHVLALGALIPLLPGWSRGVTGRIAAVLGVLAFILALSPLARAVPVAGDLPARLTAAFGASTPRSLPNAPPRSSPLSAASLFVGVDSPPVVASTHTYLVRDGTPLELDIYRSARATDASIANAPVIVMIHGGSWRGGFRGDLAPLNRYLAARGYLVAAVSYRFAPAHPYPAASQDVNAAVAWLKTNASMFGGDPSRVAFIGRSAGGQLALLAAYTANDPAVRGTVGFYASTDQKYGYENPTNPRVLNSTEILQNFLSGSPATAAAAYRSSSPINHVDSNTVPTLLIHGTRDELVFVTQSERLEARLSAARRPHLFLELPWATHGCDFNFSGPCGQLSTYAIERFLASVMK